MADYRLSEEADRDIYEIAQYTLEHWSEAQAQRYVYGLESAFQRLCDNPRLGKASDDVRTGYFRHRYRSHMIFFKRSDDDNVTIVRVPHGRMDFVRHL